MPTYDYKCLADECGVVHELIQSIHKTLPESLPCPRCGEDAFHVILTAPGVLTGNMSQKTEDVAIGKDAEARWNRIHERQAHRDKIRQDSGKQGLTMVGRDEYVATDKQLYSVTQANIDKTNLRSTDDK